MKWLCVALVVAAACAATEDEQRVSKQAVIQSIDVLARCVGVLRKADDDAQKGGYSASAVDLGLLARGCLALGVCPPHPPLTLRLFPSQQIRLQKARRQHRGHPRAHQEGQHRRALEALQEVRARVLRRQQGVRRRGLGSYEAIPDGHGADHGEHDSRDGQGANALGAARREKRREGGLKRGSGSG